MDYLRLCKLYGLTDVDLPGLSLEENNSQSEARVPPIHGSVAQGLSCKLKEMGEILLTWWILHKWEAKFT